ncbi:putative 2OG-Fe(II) oxygenase family oxidoreductase [Microthyrium microscopicum]|uniref:Putative 2OG-Fe(II) oxygenase family oxidoreductase n=1 Tax=Microthyrium microscopicum TaxID=703497 RepID=A0A6A6UDD3_9PEZI|nr:putative 2OG-Fe(II) oxygenase family oxidoreductase [Microthyrium microscopicum]
MGSQPVQFSIPTVDLSTYLRDPEAEQANEIVSAIRDACITSGFFQITGHGISTELQDAVFKSAEVVFKLPVEEKIKLQSATDGRGYEVIGAQTLEVGMKADLNESYYVGPEVAVKESYRNFQYPNVWPSTDLISESEFKEPVLEYREQMCALANILMRCLAKGLGLDQHFFDGFCKDPIANVRLLHYPPQPNLDDPKQLGAGAHTDFGAITLLMQDDMGGLQVRKQDTAEWIDVKPNRDAYVVNIGDMMQKWTKGEYNSNVHRVINRSGKERYSVPFFFDGNLDYVLRPLDGSEDVEYTVEEFMKERFQKAYGTK